MNPFASEFVPSFLSNPPPSNPPAQPSPNNIEKNTEDHESWEDDVVYTPGSIQTHGTGAKDSNKKSPSNPVSSPKTQVKAESIPENNTTDKKVSTPNNESSKQINEIKDVFDEREHLNIVFIGHVDAGKSTISGQILLQTGEIEERLISKYEKEAKEKNRESWYLAFIMDTNEEERARGKTVEVGRAHFETSKKRYTILDAPGHKLYVPNMIGGAAQADVAVLVISTRKGEFETGFEKGGQTREHAMLAKTLGVNRLIVVMNKMDDQTVQWSEQRFNECKEKLLPFLKSCGFNIKQDVEFIPISGQMGINISKDIPPNTCPWYKGTHVLGALDNLPPIKRAIDKPLRIPILGRFREMGVLCTLGKVEAGLIRNNDKLCVAPSGFLTECIGIEVEGNETTVARCGDNVSIKLKDILEEDLQTGYVICPYNLPCPNAIQFDAQMAILDLLEHKPIFSAGYSCILHVHTLSTECELTEILSEVNKKTGKPYKKKPTFCKSGAVISGRITVLQTIAIEIYKDVPQLGRFTLRDEGRTIAVGKITTIYNSMIENNE